MIFPSTFQTRIEPVEETPTAGSTRESHPSFQQSKINADHQFSKVIRILIRQENKIDATHYLVMMLRQHEIGQVGVEANPVTTCDDNELNILPNSTGAKNGAIDKNTVLSDPSLQLIVEQWSKIPDSIKLEIILRVTGFIASQ
jgi:hypothetical protein